MKTESRHIISVMSRDGNMEVMATGSISEIMTALEVSAATIFLQMNGGYDEETLYKFLELHCQSIKDLAEVGANDGD